MIFPLLVLKGIYHHWKYVFFFFQGAEANESFRRSVGMRVWIWKLLESATQCQELGSNWGALGGMRLGFTRGLGVRCGCGCQNRFGIPFWLAGEFTTHFRTYFSGWIESDVHWGYGILTHGHVGGRDELWTMDECHFRTDPHSGATGPKYAVLPS